MSAVAYIVGTDYFSTLGLKVLRGREFTAAEEQDKVAVPVAIIDEPLARKLFGEENPVGQQIQFPPREEAGPASGNGIVIDNAKDERQVMEVVGVVPGLRHDLFDKGPVAHVYLPFGSQFRSGMNVHLRLGSTTPAAQAALLQAVRRGDPRGGRPAAGARSADDGALQGFERDVLGRQGRRVDVRRLRPRRRLPGRRRALRGEGVCRGAADAENRHPGRARVDARRRAAGWC